MEENSIERHCLFNKYIYLHAFSDELSIVEAEV